MRAEPLAKKEIETAKIILAPGETKSAMAQTGNQKLLLEPSTHTRQNPDELSNVEASPGRSNRPILVI